MSGFRESNEELQAQMLNKGLEEGRSLLANPAHNNSLAAELEAMDENEVRMDQLVTYIYQKYLIFTFLSRFSCCTLLYRNIVRRNIITRKKKKQICHGWTQLLV